MKIEEIVDLERYPLDAPGTDAWSALVSRCRTDLDKNGMFNLEGFLRPAIAEEIAGRIQPVMDTSSFTHARDHNIYFDNDIDGLNSDHPALKKMQTVNHTVCADQIEGNPVMVLYQWQPFIEFLAATMQKAELYPMADPLARVNVMAYHEGEALNWHFDRSEFTTTLLLQSPEKGGEFQYRSDLRTDEDQNFDGVARLLAGLDDQVRNLALAPGTLNVFKGKNTAHRVAPVKGARSRVIAVFSYYETAGKQFTEQERIGFYGRAG